MVLLESGLSQTEHFWGFFHWTPIMVMVPSFILSKILISLPAYEMAGSERRIITLLIDFSKYIKYTVLVLN